MMDINTTTCRQCGLGCVFCNSDDFDDCLICQNGMYLEQGKCKICHEAC